MTLENLEERKAKALSLLDTHADEYRVFYSKVTGIKELTSEAINQLKLEREQLSLKADVIHTQIQFIEELIEHISPKTEPVITAYEDK